MAAGSWQASSQGKRSGASRGHFGLASLRFFSSTLRRHFEWLHKLVFVGERHSIRAARQTHPFSARRVAFVLSRRDEFCWPSSGASVVYTQRGCAKADRAGFFPTEARAKGAFSLKRAAPFFVQPICSLIENNNKKAERQTREQRKKSAKVKAAAVNIVCVGSFDAAARASPWRTEAADSI